jgi:hypothetical protein
MGLFVDLSESNYTRSPIQIKNIRFIWLVANQAAATHCRFEKFADFNKVGATTNDTTTPTTVSKAQGEMYLSSAEAKERAASPNLTFLRSLAIAVNEDRRLNQSLSATQLVNLCVERDIVIPGLSEDSQTDVDAGKRQLGTVMGRLFGELAELTVEDFRVVKEEESVTNDQGNWQSLKKYTFSIVQRPAPNTI